MADNRHAYGFRYYSNLAGGGCPPSLEYRIASAYQSSEGGGSVDVNVGDPVTPIADGTMIHTADTGGASGAALLFGVVSAVVNARVDSNGKSRPASYLPGGTTYTLDRDASKVMVTPFGRVVWEVDTITPGSIDTYAEYEALIGANCDFAYDRDITASPKLKANPVLDLSTVTTSTANFRIVGVSKTQENSDFSGANVKLLVVANETVEAPFTVTGI